MKIDVENLLRGVCNESYAKEWETAMVSGNGKQGVMIFGSPCEETIIGSHNRLFSPETNHYEIPDMSPFLNR